MCNRVPRISTTIITRFAYRIIIIIIPLVTLHYILVGVNYTYIIRVCNVGAPAAPQSALGATGLIGIFFFPLAPPGPPPPPTVYWRQKNDNYIIGGRVRGRGGEGAAAKTPGNRNARNKTNASFAFCRARSRTRRGVRTVFANRQPYFEYSVFFFSFLHISYYVYYSIPDYTFPTLFPPEQPRIRWQSPFYRAPGTTIVLSRRKRFHSNPG